MLPRWHVTIANFTRSLRACAHRTQPWLAQARASSSAYFSAGTVSVGVISCGATLSGGRRPPRHQQRQTERKGVVIALAKAEPLLTLDCRAKPSGYDAHAMPVTRQRMPW